MLVLRSVRFPHIFDGYIIPSALCSNPFCSCTFGVGFCVPKHRTSQGMTGAVGYDILLRYRDTS